MFSLVLIGIMLPFFGTAIGSSAVFAMKKRRRQALTDCLCGFSGGVMIASSLWSLLLPAIEGSQHLASLAFLPSCVGFLSGTAFMIFCEKISHRLQKRGSQLKKGPDTAFAVTVHNFPEGMAVGLAFAAFLSFRDELSLSSALSLSVGIAIQNIPEGAIVSLPLLSDRIGKTRAFLTGVISGAVEPLGAVMAIFFASLFSSLMPYFLSFAAGTMIFVVMNELSEEMHGEKGRSRGMVFFAIGFAVMMSLDVALG